MSKNFIFDDGTIQKAAKESGFEIREYFDGTDCITIGKYGMPLDNKLTEFSRLIIAEYIKYQEKIL